MTHEKFPNILSVFDKSLKKIGKNCAQVLYYQQPFFQSGQFPGKMNWTACSWIFRVYPAFLKLETHLKIDVRTRTCTGSFHEIFKCKR